MPTRKTFSVPLGALDVPGVLVGALLVFLIVLFVPAVLVTPDLPSALPPLGFNSEAILAAHARAPTRTSPAWLDAAFDTLTRAVAVRDVRTLGGAQREFASLLVDAAGEDPAARIALREHYLRRFLRAVESGAPDALAVVAARHRLVGPERAPETDPGMVRAWFDFRWEALAAREVLHGQSVGLEALLERIPPDERRAFVAWVLRSECDAVVGLSRGEAMVQQHYDRCARVRREFIAQAARLEPGYARAEAAAAVDALLALALEGLAHDATDEAARGVLQTASRDAYAQAHAAYRELAARAPSRRLRRYLIATSRGMGE